MWESFAERQNLPIIATIINLKLIITNAHAHVVTKYVYTCTKKQF